MARTKKSLKGNQKLTVAKEPNQELLKQLASMREQLIAEAERMKERHKEDLRKLEEDMNTEIERICGYFTKEQLDMPLSKFEKHLQEAEERKTQAENFEREKKALQSGTNVEPKKKPVNRLSTVKLRIPQNFRGTNVKPKGIPPATKFHSAGAPEYTKTNRFRVSIGRQFPRVVDNRGMEKEPRFPLPGEIAYSSSGSPIVVAPLRSAHESAGRMKTGKRRPTKLFVESPAQSSSEEPFSSTGFVDEV